MNGPREDKKDNEHIQEHLALPTLRSTSIGSVYTNKRGREWVLEWTSLWPWDEGEQAGGMWMWHMRDGVYKEHAIRVGEDPTWGQMADFCGGGDDHFLKGKWLLAIGPFARDWDGDRAAYVEIENDEVIRRWFTSVNLSIKGSSGLICTYVTPSDLPIAKEGLNKIVLRQGKILGEGRELWSKQIDKSIGNGTINIKNNYEIGLWYNIVLYLQDDEAWSAGASILL